MWNHIDWIVTPNIGDVARTGATWTGRIFTIVLCVDAHVVSCICFMHIGWLCRTRLVVFFWCFLSDCYRVVPYCTVMLWRLQHGEPGMHARHTSIIVARSSSSHLWMKLTSLWRCNNIFEMYDCARIVIHPLSCTPSLILSAQYQSRVHLNNVSAATHPMSHW